MLAVGHWREQRAKVDKLHIWHEKSKGGNSVVKKIIYNKYMFKKIVTDFN